VCGGGRYDGLIEELGGAPTPGIGFAMGIERIMMALRQQGVVPPALPAPRVQVSPLGQAARLPALRMTAELRENGIGALLAFGSRSLKSQLKSADKAGIAYTLILGDQELANDVIVVRNMVSSQQETVALDSVVDWLRARV
jgi:histidyl-tRNA synthetase